MNLAMVTMASMHANHTHSYTTSNVGSPYRLGPVPGMLLEAQLTSTSTM